MARVWPLLGALVVSSEVAILTFDIIFAITLSRNSSIVQISSVAIVASTFSSLTVVLLLVLLGRQIRYRNGAHIQDFAYGRRHTCVLAGFAGAFGVLSAVASAVFLGTMKIRTGDIPGRTINSSTDGLVTGAFIVWAISLLLKACFIISVVIIPKNDSLSQPADTEDPEQFPEMLESRHRASSVQGDIHLASQSMDSNSAPRARSRAGSDTMSSFRSSFSQVVRPITSKTKLISPNNRSPYRPQSTRSIDSSHRDTSISIEDGFDSWDTSTVDPQSREAVASASPSPPRFLETIPASPTGSRSPSPGFPLDLEPPKMRQRSRSYSPANSYRDLPKTARTTSPTESTNSESHIHPLFRTDSPTPPPAITPGTVVTAAPGAGQVIQIASSDRLSIRSIHRMRSGSLPSSPLAHSASLDSIRRAMEREELERLEKVEIERTLTPPIPDFVLNGGPRNSNQGYNTRKKSQTSLRKLGEVDNE